MRSNPDNQPAGPRRLKRNRARRVVRIALAAGLLLVGVYFYATRPEHLRAQALGWLQGRTTARVAIEQVEFSLWRGLELTGVSISPDDAEPATGTSNSGRRAANLRVHYARIGCDLGLLLLGQFHPRAIELDGVDFCLLAATDQANHVADFSQTAGGGTWRLPLTLRRNLPRCRFDELDARILALDGPETRLLKRWRLSGQGAPTPTGYELRVQPAGTSADTQPLAVFSWSDANGALTATMDWLDLDTAVALLPGPLAALQNKLDLGGKVKLDQATLSAVSSSDSPDPHNGGTLLHLSGATLRLANLRCALPVEESPGGDTADPPHRFLQLRDGEITARWQDGDGQHPREVALAGTAELNGAPAEFQLIGQPELFGSGWQDADNIRSVNLRLTGWAFPDPHDELFNESPRLPSVVRGVLRDYHPEGPMNLRLSFARNEGAGPEKLLVDGDLEALGCRCRHFRFLYDLTDVRGHVLISNQGVRFDGVTGQHGAGSVRATGLIEHAHANSGFDLTFDGTNIALDRDLFAALPETYQRLWERVGVEGVCNAQVRVQRDEPRDARYAEPTDVQVDARLLNGSVQVDRGRRLQSVAGTITIAHDEVTVHDLTGQLDGAAVCVWGSLGMASGDAFANMSFEASDVPFEQHMTPDPQHPQDAFSLRGRADVWGQSSGAAGAAKLSDYVAHVKDGRLLALVATTPWDQCDGWIRQTPDRQDVLSFTARQGAARLRGAASFATTPGGSEVRRLDIAVTDAAMDQLLPQIAPARWSSMVSKLGLAGRGTLSLELRRESPDDLAAPLTARVQISAERLRSSWLPLELTQIEGLARLSATGVDELHMVGSCGATGEVEIGGRDVGEQGGEFHVRGTGIDVTPELIAALPAPAARVLGSVSPRGRIAVDLDPIRVTHDMDAAWNLAGRLTLDDVQLELGLPLTELAGQLHGTAGGDENGTHLDLAVALDRGRVAGRLLENWEGRLIRSAGERGVRLTDWHGRLCDGDALASVAIDPADGSYEFSLTFQNARFADLFASRAPASDPAHQARADGHLLLRGLARDPSSRSGTGELRIRGVPFLQTPVLTQLAASSPPAGARFDDAVDVLEIRFLWRGSELELTSAELRTRDLRLVGTGTWNIANDVLDLTLAGAHPDNWPRLGGLGDWLDSAGQDLLQYHIQGTLAAPRVTIEPLHRMSEALRALVRTGG